MPRSRRPNKQKQKRSKPNGKKKIKIKSSSKSEGGDSNPTGNTPTTAGQTTSQPIAPQDALSAEGHPRQRSASCSALSSLDIEPTSCSESDNSETESSIPDLEEERCQEPNSFAPWRNLTGYRSPVEENLETSRNESVTDNELASCEGPSTSTKTAPEWVKTTLKFNAVRNLTGISAAIFLNRAVKRYTAGEFVTGYIEIAVEKQLSCRRISVHCRGLCNVKTHLYQKYDPDDNMDDAFQESFNLLHRTMELWPEGSDEKEFLKNGHHSFPFSLFLPENTPQTHKDDDDRMSIEYFLVLEIVRSGPHPPIFEVMTALDVIPMPVMDVSLQKSVVIETELASPDESSWIKFEVEINKPVIESVDGQFRVIIKANELINQGGHNLKIFPVLVQRISMPSRPLILQRVIVDFYKNVQHVTLSTQQGYTMTYQFKVPDILTSTVNMDNSPNSIKVLYLLMIHAWRADAHTPTLLVKRHIDVVCPMWKEAVFEVESIQGESTSLGQPALQEELSTQSVLRQEADSTVDNAMGDIQEPVGGGQEEDVVVLQSSQEDQTVENRIDHESLYAPSCSYSNATPDRSIKDRKCKRKLPWYEKARCEDQQNEHQTESLALYSEPHEFTSLTAPIYIDTTQNTKDGAETCSFYFKSGPAQAMIEVELPEKHETTKEDITFIFANTSQDSLSVQNDHAYVSTHPTERASQLEFDGFEQESLRASKKRASEAKLCELIKKGKASKNYKAPEPCPIHEGNSEKRKRRLHKERIIHRLIYSDNMTCLEIEGRRKKGESVHVCPLRKTSRTYGGDGVSLLFGDIIESFGAPGSQCVEFEDSKDKQKLDLALSKRVGVVAKETPSSSIAKESPGEETIQSEKVQSSEHGLQSKEALQENKISQEKVQMLVILERVNPCVFHALQNEARKPSESEKTKDTLSDNSEVKTAETSLAGTLLPSGIVDNKYQEERSQCEDASSRDVSQAAGLVNEGKEEMLLTEELVSDDTQSEIPKVDESSIQSQMEDDTKTLTGERKWTNGDREKRHSQSRSPQKRSSAHLTSVLDEECKSIDVHEKSTGERNPVQHVNFDLFHTPHIQNEGSEEFSTQPIEHIEMVPIISGSHDNENKTIDNETQSQYNSIETINIETNSSLSNRIETIEDRSVPRVDQSGGNGSESVATNSSSSGRMPESGDSLQEIQRDKENKTPSAVDTSATEVKKTKPKRPRISDRFCKPKMIVRRRRSSGNDKDPPSNPKSTADTHSTSGKSSSTGTASNSCGSQSSGQHTSQTSEGKVASGRQDSIEMRTDSKESESQSSKKGALIPNRKLRDITRTFQSKHNSNSVDFRKKIGSDDGMSCSENSKHVVVPHKISKHSPKKIGLGSDRNMNKNKENMKNRQDNEGKENSSSSKNESYSHTKSTAMASNLENESVDLGGKIGSDNGTSCLENSKHPVISHEISSHLSTKIGSENDKYINENKENDKIRPEYEGKGGPSSSNDELHSPEKYIVIDLNHENESVDFGQNKGSDDGVSCSENDRHAVISPKISKHSSKISSESCKDVNENEENIENKQDCERKDETHTSDNELQSHVKNLAVDLNLENESVDIGEQNRVSCSVNNNHVVSYEISSRLSTKTCSENEKDINKDNIDNTQDYEWKEESSSSKNANKISIAMDSNLEIESGSQLGKCAENTNYENNDLKQENERERQTSSFQSDEHETQCYPIDLTNKKTPLVNNEPLAPHKPVEVSTELNPGSYSQMDERQRLMVREQFEGKTHCDDEQNRSNPSVTSSRSVPRTEVEGNSDSKQESLHMKLLFSDWGLGGQLNLCAFTPVKGCSKEGSKDMEKGDNAAHLQGAIENGQHNETLQVNTYSHVQAYPGFSNLQANPHYPHVQAYPIYPHIQAHSLCPHPQAHPLHPHPHCLQMYPHCPHFQTHPNELKARPYLQAYADDFPYLQTYPDYYNLPVYHNELKARPPASIPHSMQPPMAHQNSGHEFAKGLTDFMKQSAKQERYEMKLLLEGTTYYGNSKTQNPNIREFTKTQGQEMNNCKLKDPQADNVDGFHHFINYLQHVEEEGVSPIDEASLPIMPSFKVDQYNNECHPPSKSDSTFPSFVQRRQPFEPALNAIRMPAKGIVSTSSEASPKNQKNKAEEHSAPGRAIRKSITVYGSSCLKGSTPSSNTNEPKSVQRSLNAFRKKFKRTPPIQSDSRQCGKRTKDENAAVNKNTVFKDKEFHLRKVDNTKGNIGQSENIGAHIGEKEKRRSGREIRSRKITEHDDYVQLQSKKRYYLKTIQEIQAHLSFHSWHEHKFDRLKMLQEEVTIIDKSLHQIRKRNTNVRMSSNKIPSNQKSFRMRASKTVAVSSRHSSTALRKRDPKPVFVERQQNAAKHHDDADATTSANNMHVQIWTFIRRSSSSSSQKYTSDHVHHSERNNRFVLKQPRQRRGMR